MRVFIHNFAYIEKGVKCRGKKFIYPKCLKVRFPNLYSSRTISVGTRTFLYPDGLFCTHDVYTNESPRLLSGLLLPFDV